MQKVSSGAYLSKAVEYLIVHLNIWQERLLNEGIIEPGITNGGYIFCCKAVDDIGYNLLV